MPEANAVQSAILTPDPTLDPIYGRLEDQIDWYDRKSRAAQRIFKRIKIVEILGAAAIPFLAGLNYPGDKLVTGGLGVLITILEGLLHLNQYQQNWTNYRSTCEALRHEKFVYLAKAGPYTTAPDPRALLAERVESTVSQEHAQWASVQQQSAKNQGNTDPSAVS
ncbi:MAG: DUF4231 domain-containing protein [Terracidiphilus sp.]